MPPTNKSVRDFLLPLLKRVKRMIAASTPNGEEVRMDATMKDTAKRHRVFAPPLSVSGPGSLMDAGLGFIRS